MTRLLAVIKPQHLNPGLILNIQDIIWVLINKYVLKNINQASGLNYLILSKMHRKRFRLEKFLFSSVKTEKSAYFYTLVPSN